MDRPSIFSCSLVLDYFCVVIPCQEVTRKGRGRGSSQKSLPCEHKGMFVPHLVVLILSLKNHLVHADYASTDVRLSYSKDQGGQKQSTITYWASETAQWVKKGVVSLVMGIQCPEFTEKRKEGDN